MSATLHKLLDGVQAPQSPHHCDAVYFPSMDYILYLRQDTCYVADRIDEYLTLLRDPVSADPIGVKLKGFYNIYLELKRTLPPAVASHLESRIPFRAFIAFAEALACTVGDEVIADSEQARRYDAYALARKIVDGQRISSKELDLVAA